MKEYEDSFILIYQRSENGKIVVNHFTCESCTRIKYLQTRFL